MKIYKLVALFILATAPALASQYVAVEFGTNHMELTDRSDSGLKVGYKGAVKVGYIFSNGVRTEVEGSYRRNDFKTLYTFSDKDEVSSKEHRHIHSWSYMANVLYDIAALSFQGATPYFGAGVGYAQNTEHNKIQFNQETNKDKLRDNRFAYQAIGGVKYALNENYAAALEYQYHCGQSHAKAHSVGLSLIRHF